MEMFKEHTIYFNEELGEILKSFRQAYKKKGTVIAKVVDKAGPYISKLESGGVKKISSSDLEKICNDIVGNENGLMEFVRFAYSVDSEDKNEDSRYSLGTTLTLRNIDDVICRFPLTEVILNSMTSIMDEKNISFDELLTELNANRDLDKYNATAIKELPYNLYQCVTPDDSTRIAIKLLYSSEDLNYILHPNNIESTKINIVSIEAILYSLYKLSGIEPDEAHKKAMIQMMELNILGARKKVVTIEVDASNDKDVADKLGTLEPDAQKTYEQIIQLLKIYLLITQNRGGLNYVNKFFDNLKKDPGYTMAFCGIDLDKLIELPRETKLDFLNKVRALAKEYSEKTSDSIDLYND